MAIHRNRQLVISEALEHRTLLSIAPTFAPFLTPFTLPGFLSSYTFGRFNNDSRTDIIAASTENSSSIYPGERHDAVSTNTARGVYAEIDIYTAHQYDVDLFLTDFKTGDYNGDGKVDLFSARYAGGVESGTAQLDVSVMPGFGNGVFDPIGRGNGIRYTKNQDFFLGAGYTTADVTGDGKTDVIIAGVSGIRVYSDLDGSGNYDTIAFTNDTPTFGTVAAVDLNGDGRRDLIYGAADSTGDRIYLRLNLGSGRFSDPIASPLINDTPRQLRFGDFNADGKVDVAVLESTSEADNSRAAVDVMLGNGIGAFGAPIHYAFDGYIGGLTVADFDGDGSVDIAVGISGSRPGMQSIQILGNTGNATFAQFEVRPGDSYIDQLDSGDFNGDGKTDLIFRDLGTGQLRVIYNSTPKASTITGTVFTDSDGNGRMGTGESGIGAGKTVWADDNNNGLLDSNESYATTKPDGTYRLAVTDGDHTIRAVLPAGYLQTPIRKPYTFTVSNISGGASYGGYSFGVLYLGTINGAIWNDSNGNHKFDDFESAVTQATVFIDSDHDGGLSPGDQRASIRADGYYGFSVPAGRYDIRILPLDGYSRTTPAPVYLVNLAPRVTMSGYDFGLARPGGATGTVYYDTTKFGRIIDGDAGVPGVRVYSDRNNNRRLDKGEPYSTTDVNGDYNIPNQPAGQIVLRMLNPWKTTVFTEPVNGTLYGTVIGGSSAGGGDFGIYHRAVVTGNVYNDKNVNGAFDAAEAGLAGFYVFVDYNGNGTADLYEPGVRTDESGTYFIEGTRAGTFTVIASRLSGYSGTNPDSSTRSVNFVFDSVASGYDFGMIAGAFRTAPYKPPVNILTGQNPVAIATGDFNNDGRNDFVVASNNSLSETFLNLGGGAFPTTPSNTFPIGGATRDLVTADLNADGNLDLIAADQDDDNGTGVFGGIAILYGRGNGTFENPVRYSADSGTYGVAVADFNGDGRLDIVAANSAASTFSIFFAKVEGEFDQRLNITVPFGATSIAAGDINGDKKADIVLASPSDSSITVVMGKGNGTFEAPSRQTVGTNTPSFVTLGDFNRDGLLDMSFVNTDANQVVVRNYDGRRKRFGGAITYSTVDSPRQVKVIDVDADGTLDLIVAGRSDGGTDISGGVSLLRGHGDGTFASQLVATAHTSPTAIAFADFNRDRKLDILVANFFSSDVSVLVNKT